MINIIDDVFQIIRYSIKDVFIFPGDNLESVFRYSCLITVISFIMEMLGLPTFKNWIGALIASLILKIIIYVGRSEKESALPRSDGNAKLLARDYSSREKVSSSEGETEGDEDVIRYFNEHIGE